MCWSPTLKKIKDKLIFFIACTIRLPPEEHNQSSSQSKKPNWKSWKDWECRKKPLYPSGHVSSGEDMAWRRHSLHYRRKLHWYVTGKRGWKEAGVERDVCVFRYSEGDVQAGHASLGETDMCVFHREDRRGKLHRIYLQTLRVSSATLRACLCVCVCCVFAADREAMRSLNNSAAFLPLLLPPPDPPITPCTPCFFCMFLQGFFFFPCARTLQERIVLLSGGAAGVRARLCRGGTARSRKDCPSAGSPSSKRLQVWKVGCQQTGAGLKTSFLCTR